MLQPPHTPSANAAAIAWRISRPTVVDAPSADPGLRRRGLIQGIVGATVGLGFSYFGHSTLAMVVWTIAGITLLAAVFSPNHAYAWIHRAGERLGHLLSSAMTYILLVPLFFGFFAVFGLLARRGRRDKLERWFDRETTTYWHTRNDDDRDLAYYERQF